jgi:hypothetical protein
VPTFRPSAQVTLDIRVENFNDTAALDSRLRPGTPPPTATAGRRPQASTRELNRQIAQINETIRQTERAPVEHIGGDETLREFTLRDMRQNRDALVNALARVEERPLPPALDGSAPDDNYVRSGIIPQRTEIEKNSYRTADTCTLVLDWKDMPFDPRLIRACAVDVLVGVVSAENYDAGVRGARGSTGQLLSVINPNAENALGSQVTRFLGFVDTWTVEYDESSGDKITLECRDLTGVFLDTPLASGSAINLDEPLDKGIAQFIATYPGVAGIPVIFAGSFDESSRAPAPRIGQAIPRQMRARRGRRAQQTRSGDQRMNIWDHITDVCQQAGGFIPSIRADKLFILDPRTLYLNDPRAARRVMVYGRNLSSLQFTRKMAGTRTPTVEVRCYDPSIGRTRWARYPVANRGDPASGVFGRLDPAAPTRANTPGVSGANPSETIQTIGVRGINDPRRLEAIARNVFQQTGRQEIEGNFSTESSVSWDRDTDTPGRGVEFSMLALEAGDSVEMTIAPAPAAINRRSTQGLSVAVIQALSREARAEYLRRLGWDPAVAERFSALQEASGFQTIFRAQNIRVKMDAEDGLSIKADFINYIEVREDAPAAQDPRPDPPTDDMAELIDATPGDLGAQLQAVRDQRSVLTATREAGGIDEDVYQQRLGALQQQEHNLQRLARSQ